MKRKKTPSDEARKLLRFWERNSEFGDPIGCVATTFTFDAPFFEEECLGRFTGIESNPREDQFGYLVEREERLSQVFACVLVDRNHVAKQRSLRWHLLPIRVPGGGIQHAKVSLLAWEEHIRVLVSSANLTEPGYRSNWERLAALDFTPQGDVPLEILREVLDFLERLQKMAPPATAPGHGGPHAGLTQFLAGIRRKIGRWTDPAWPRGEPSAIFLPVYPGGDSLFDQIKKDAWRGTGAEMARVLSPFYDKGDAAKRVVDHLVDAMAVQGVRTLEFRGPGRRFPDGRVEIDLPECLRKAWGPRRVHEFRIIGSGTSDGESRALHAKGVWLERDGKAIDVLGSSNFTAAGVGLSGGVSNVEANVAYILPDSRSAFARMCLDALPPSEAVDPDTGMVSFLADTADRTPTDEEAVPLPAGFGLALYVPEGEAGKLLLHIEPTSPPGFQVIAEDGPILVDDSHGGWPRGESPTERPWANRRPPSHLLVRWTTGEGEKKEAIWVVNVTDTSLLPAPDELRGLDLEELLEILTSARPLHEMVSSILKRRAREQAIGIAGPIVDPHKKVDTRNFLIRRVRRVSAALEGLKRRLERPVSSLDALRWRLHGPVGPMVLAQRLAESEGQGAAFMIAEVALTTHQADWSAAERALGPELVREETRAVVSRLRALADSHTSPENLSAYVRECFEEVHR